MASHSDLYISRNLFYSPIYVAFIPDEDAWKKELRRLKVTSQPYPNTNGRTTYFTSRDDKTICLVTVNERCDEDYIVAASVLAHETVHVVEEIFREIGEDKPSEEFRAYLTQTVFRQLCTMYTKTRCKKPPE